MFGWLDRETVRQLPPMTVYELQRIVSVLMVYVLNVLVVWEVKFFLFVENFRVQHSCFCLVKHKRLGFAFLNLTKNSN